MIEIRFVSPPSEARPQTGDNCQMVESVAFFEAYRPVLEGLQSMSETEFPFKVIIIYFIIFAIWFFLSNLVPRGFLS